MLSASIGTTFQLASNVYSSSYTCCMIVPTRSAVDAIGSSVCGSPIIAMLAAPPLGGAASAAPVASAIAADDDDRGDGEAGATGSQGVAERRRIQR